MGYFSTKDLEIVLQHLGKKYDDIHLFGFSVGANLIQNYLTDLWALKEEKQAEADGKPLNTPKRPYFRDVVDLDMEPKLASAVCISPIYHFQTSCKLISSKPWINPVLCQKFFSYLNSNMAHDEFKTALDTHKISPVDLKKGKKTFLQLNQAIIQAVLKEEDGDKAFDLVSPRVDLQKVQTKMLCISSLDDIIVE